VTRLGLILCGEQVTSAKGRSTGPPQQARVTSRTVDASRTLQVDLPSFTALFTGSKLPASPVSSCYNEAKEATMSL